ncbi:hypothetical protein DN069_24010 [Streptacidiphilus pinicola]|uniref:Uncharacterized protein n=1 Tax=Streptacidiphilus pinicola TaxID=2219663 RepID=A0A2X0K1E2_9ACTN|nr:hypothetical protein [Streptacidiphilus pinicola]RAG83105.1 hypothetical protein DN069_24010 [Streptacidiphilus pinicola]
MLALTGSGNLLRLLGGHAARVLAAVEPQSLHRRARHNAAGAAARASADRRETEEVNRWLAGQAGLTGADALRCPTA